MEMKNPPKPFQKPILEFAHQRAIKASTTRNIGWCRTQASLAPDVFTLSVQLERFDKLHHLLHRNGEILCLGVATRLARFKTVITIGQPT